MGFPWSADFISFVTQDFCQVHGRSAAHVECVRHPVAKGLIQLQILFLWVSLFFVLKVNSYFSDQLGSEKCMVISNHTTRTDWLLMILPIIDANRGLDFRFSLKVR